MKIALVSSAALPSPAPDYSGLENIVAWCAEEFAKAGHDVTLITTRGGEWSQATPHKNLQVIETIAPGWDAEAEMKHFLVYRDLIQQEYTKANTIVWDNTWLHYNYLIAESFPKMRLVSSHHGMLGFTTPPDGVLWPRFVGLSKAHAMYMSTQLKVAVRHVYNGIKMPGEVVMSKDGDYLLSLNRISPEKGIIESIDVALANRMKIAIVGDDTKVGNHEYVRRVIDRCFDSNGMAEYYGLVDNSTKVDLLRNCKAVIGCPHPTWVEAFGLYAVEAMAYGKPVLATYNGGLTETIVHKKTGFLAHTPEELKEYVPLLDTIDPEDCAKRAEQFSVENMAKGYLSLFSKVLDGDRW